MTPAEWEVLSNRGWREFYPIVHDHATQELAKLQPGAEISMTELIERLFPSSLARGNGITARQKMFDAMIAAVKKDLLQGYHHPGPARRYMGKNVHPHVWHAYDAQHVKVAEIECPCCGTKFVPTN